MREHRPRLHVLLAAVTLAVLATLAPAGSAVAAGGGKPAPVRITLKPDVTGKVVSDRAACVKNRYVYLFGHEAGSDEVAPLGSTTTDNHGQYPGELKRGTPISKLFTIVLGSSKCRIAQSETIPAPQRAGHLAQRKVTLKIGQTRISGRVTSKKDSCVKQATVFLFARLDPGDPWQAAVSTTTDNQGHYVYSLSGRRSSLSRGTTEQVLAVVIGDRTCSVAQSPTRTIG